VFQFIFDSYSTYCIIYFDSFWNQTSHHVWHGALTRIKKYFSILYKEGSTVQTSMAVEFSHSVFDIYRRKNNRLDERVTYEHPVKCFHRCSDNTRLQGWKKKRTRQNKKRKKSKVNKKDDITHHKKRRALVYYESSWHFLREKSSQH
jgi:hypothetical protein